jgi:hypothetical protein
MMDQTEPLSTDALPSYPSELPTFLLNWEPLEAEDMPLQVALLTMELATVRQALKATQADLAAVMDRIGI